MQLLPWNTMFSLALMSQSFPPGAAYPAGARGDHCQDGQLPPVDGEGAQARQAGFCRAPGAAPPGVGGARGAL